MGSSSHQVLRTRVPTCLSGPYRYALNSKGPTPYETLRRRHEFVEHVVRILVAFMAPFARDVGGLRDLESQLNRPSIGAWLHAADQMAEKLGSSHPVVGPVAGILRESGRRKKTQAWWAFRRLTENRNEISHFRADASSTQELQAIERSMRDLLGALEAFKSLEVFAMHRLDLGATPPMAEVHRLRGLEPMRAPDIEWVSGMRPGEPWILDGQGRAHSLAPWLIVDWRTLPTSLVLERWDDDGPHYWSERLDKDVPVPHPLRDTLVRKQLLAPRDPIELRPCDQQRLLSQAPDATPQLDGLRLDRKLGEGASGQVWLAHKGEVQVAVKVLRRELADDPDQRERLRREYQALRSLNVQGIPSAMDLLEDDLHGPVLVMEYIPGQNLYTHCAGSGMDLTGARRLVECLLSCLVQAHKRGIVHRDIKPQNIVLARKGVPVLLDFGIASVRDAGYLTKTYDRMGTVAFAPPEQIHGGSVGPWSDCYSVGRVLGFALTRSSDPDVHIKALPTGLLPIYHQATQPEPHQRFQSAEEMLRALKAADPTGPPVRTGMTLAGTWHIAEQISTPGPGLWAFRAFCGGSRREDAVVVASDSGRDALVQAIGGLRPDQRRALGSPQPMQAPGCTFCVLEGETPYIALDGLFRPKPAAPRSSPAPEPAPPPPPTPNPTAKPKSAPDADSSKKSEDTSKLTKADAVTWGALGALAGGAALATALLGAAALTKKNKNSKLSVPPYVEPIGSMFKDPSAGRRLAALHRLSMVLLAQSVALGETRVDRATWTAIEGKPGCLLTNLAGSGLGKSVVKAVKTTPVDGPKLKALGQAARAGGADPDQAWSRDMGGRLITATMQLGPRVPHAKLDPWIRRSNQGWTLLSSLRGFELYIPIER